MLHSVLEKRRMRCKGIDNTHGRAREGDDVIANRRRDAEPVQGPEDAAVASMAGSYLPRREQSSSHVRQTGDTASQTGRPCGSKVGGRISESGNRNDAGVSWCGRPLHQRQPFYLLRCIHGRVRNAAAPASGSRAHRQYTDRENEVALLKGSCHGLNTTSPPRVPDAPSKWNPYIPDDADG